MAPRSHGDQSVIYHDSLFTLSSTAVFLAGLAGSALFFWLADGMAAAAAELPSSAKNPKQTKVHFKHYFSRELVHHSGLIFDSVREGHKMH